MRLNICSFIILFFLVGCQATSQVTVIQPPIPHIMNQDSIARVLSKGTTDQILFHVKLKQLYQRLPINSQALDQTQIQFLKLWVKGHGITGSIFNSNGFVNVAGNPDTTLSINQVPRGKNRIVVVQAYDSNQQVIPGAQLKGYYSSSTNSIVTVFLNWRFFPLADILEKLLSSNPTLNQSLEPTAVQALIDQLTYGANPVGGPTFAIHPSRLDTAIIETYLKNNDTLPPANNIPANWSTGLNTSGQMTGVPIGANIELKLLDPATQTLNLVAAATTENFTLNNTTPGNWPLKLSITSTTSTSTATINPVAAGASNVLATVPTISNFTPPGGTAGTVVTITGTNFTGATAVSFNGLAATAFTVDNPNQISATLPAGNIAGPIIVSSANGIATTVQNLTVGNIIFVDIDAVGANDGSSWANAFNTLQAGLTAATNGDQIWVSDGTYRITGARTNTFQLVVGTSLFGGFNATENLLTQRNVGANIAVLSGDINNDDVPPFTNTADNAHHVVTGANNALIDGFTVRGGNTDGAVTLSGGGMLNDNVAPSVRNMIFINNSATNDGGGMSNINNANPSINDSTFNANRAVTDDGGGIATNTSSLSLTNVTFTNNTSQDHGGGLYVIFAPQVMVENCTFTSNAATDSGGGIMVLTNSTVTVRNSNFTNNTATEDGGAIGLLTNVTATLDNLNLSNNNATDDGGGLYIASSNGSVSSTIVDNNTAGNNGGGVYNSTSPAVTYTSMTITNNTATNDGGGMYTINSGNVSITNSSINTNTATNDGGGMFNTNTHALVTNVTFNGNQTTADDGGGMHNNGSNPTITNSTFTNNISADDGGGVFNNTSNSIINNCTFTGNQAADEGGGMLNNTSNVVVTNTTLTSNTATDRGGGVYNLGASTPSFTDSSFITNAATTNNGGAFYNDTGSNASITRVIFRGNTAVDGAGMHITGGTTPTITQSVFDSNIATDDGGGINILSNSAPTITNSLFIGNQAVGAGGDGGGVRFSGATTPSIFNSTFINNSAGSNGGGINNNTSSPTLTNLILWNNTAVGVGPQINHVAGTITLSFLTIQGDIAGISGAGAITNNGNNLATDPLFVNTGDPDGGDNTYRTSDDGLRLQGASPALNSGTNVGAPAIDLIGTARPQGGTTDRGAYEQ